MRKGVIIVVVKVITDSTAYFPEEVKRGHCLTIVPLSVIFPDVSYKETEISNSEFYAKMARSPKIPTSSQPSPTNFYEVFLRNVEEGHETAATFISSELSGTYHSAQTARKMVLEKHPQARIEIVDSRATAMQLGYIVLAAARAAEQGASLDEVAEVIRETIDRSRLYFVPKTLEYLKKGGRIGGAAALMGTLLQVKPILTLREGMVAVHDKVRTTEKALNTMLSIYEEDAAKYGVRGTSIHHIDCFSEAEKIKEVCRAKIHKEISISAIGPVIGLHVGPGTLGIAYVLDN